MAAVSHVNLVLSDIQNIINKSGLHFIINHTPFSCYITLRKKLVNPDKLPDYESLKPSAILERQDPQIENLDKLKFRNTSLEEALVQLEEDTDASTKEFKETVATLHSRIDDLQTKNGVLDSELLVRDSNVDTLKKEIKTKDDIIQKLYEDFTLESEKMKLEIVELAKYKQTKIIEEKETLKKERKLIKRKKQKARKEEEKQRPQVPENNNSLDSQANLKEFQSFSCDLCNQKTDSQDQLRSHVTKVHSEVLARLARILPTLNEESTKLLDDISTSEWILTPEEITQLGIDWKIYLEIF